MKKLLLSALAVSVMFVSCKKDDNNPVTPPETGGAAKVPAKGDFIDIYSIHENMYKESSDKLVETFTKFQDRVAEGPHQGATLNQFVTWIKEVKPSGKASNGTAGELGKKPRYVNGHGIENGQLIKKGLIGAYQLSNAFIEYKKLLQPSLSKEEQQKLLENFATAIIGSYDMIENKKVKMKDHNQEFMGYPVMNGNEFAKYLNIVNNYKQYEGISDDLYNSLKDAKKNVGKYEDFKKNIREALMATQKVVAIRGVQYLKKASELKGNDLNDGVAHAISEGLGFIYSLKFANYYPKSHAQSNQIYIFDSILMGLNLWNGEASKETLETLGKDVAKTFGDFDYEKANL